MTRRSPTRSQCAALPFRRRAGRTLEVLLITSRRTGRWVIPKGWPVRKLPPHASAAYEAIEEAGVAGIVARRSLGAYSYEKRLGDGSVVICHVRVFPLEVKRQMPRWKEQAQRRRKWFEAGRAARAIKQPELSALINRLSSRR
jgi:8-oxo-dGTP pyrophosphatase MutT (NUDIX family)